MFYKINYIVDILPEGYKNLDYYIYDRVIPDTYLYVDFPFELDDLIEERKRLLASLGIIVNDYTCEEVSNDEYLDYILNKIKRRAVEFLMTEEKLPEGDMDRYLDDKVYLCRALSVFYEDVNSFLPTFYSKNHEEVHDDDGIIEWLLNMGSFKVKKDSY